MATLVLELDLPESLAREAEARGLLNPRAIESLLRAELRRGAVARSEAIEPGSNIEVPPLTPAETEATLEHVRRNHLLRRLGPAPDVILEEGPSDPATIGRIRTSHENARRNADWLQSHWADLLPWAYGKHLVVAGQQAFLGETRQEARASAKAAHPGDEGALGLYVRPPRGQST